VLDRPGVLADITRILAGSKISIDAMVQKEPGKGESRVDIVMLTHRALEKIVNQAMAKIEKLSTVVGKVTRIRLEELLSRSTSRPAATRRRAASPTSCWRASPRTAGSMSPRVIRGPISPL